MDNKFPKEVFVIQDDSLDIYANDELGAISTGSIVGRYVFEDTGHIESANPHFVSDYASDERKHKKNRKKHKKTRG